jgi:hypothetical protein
MKEYICATCIRKKYGNPGSPLKETLHKKDGWKEIAMYEHPGREMQMKCSECDKGFYYMYFREID